MYWFDFLNHERVVCYNPRDHVSSKSREMERIGLPTSCIRNAVVFPEGPSSVQLICTGQNSPKAVSDFKGAEKQLFSCCTKGRQDKMEVELGIILARHLLTQLLKRRRLPLRTHLAQEVYFTHSELGNAGIMSWRDGKICSLWEVLG